MSHITWNEIQDRAVEFAAKWQGETYEKGESQSFWSDFLNVYGIDRRRYGAYFEYAIKKLGGGQGFVDMFWPGKLLAEQKSAGRDLAKATCQAFEYLDIMPTHDLPHGIVVSDFARFQFVELESREVTSFLLEDFPKNVKLFAFLIEEKSAKLAEEDPVNRKAAEAMAALHNELRDNSYGGHDLELLLVRLVFCMFSDDSGIFERGSFQSYIADRTDIDGSDLGPRLVKIFEVLNTKPSLRSENLDQDLAGFEYINGGLFAESIRIPDFTSKLRTQLLQAMSLDWSKVSPAIFGSMFQGVMDEATRRNLGAHYTSEKNILRVIKPLFLDALYEEFAAARHSKKKLEVFHDKLAKLKFLDPACGCGNFLVITYRELRRLEHKVIEVGKKSKSIGWLDVGEYGLVRVNVDQMYGIEIEDLPSLIAETAMWLTDHQMNMEFSAQSGQIFKRLPLTAKATIVNANALTLDWQTVVNPTTLSYILGNPPFNGSKLMTEAMRNDLQAQFDGFNGTGVLDFVCAWYAKAAKFMHQNHQIQTALVSTNSISQGEQVGILWRYLLDQGIRINFAHRTFKWRNDAKGVAGVYCIIIGFSYIDKSEKKIFDYPDVKGEPVEALVSHINPYLIDAPDVLLSSRKKPITPAPLVAFGSMPLDGGHLLLDAKQENELLIRYGDEIEPYVRVFMGANEFMNKGERYCLWLKEISPEKFRKMPLVIDRVERVKAWRLNSKRGATSARAAFPRLFGEDRHPFGRYILIPRHTSESRNIIPMGFFDQHVVAGDSCLIIPHATGYDFGVLQSAMHMAWVRAVCGRLKSDYRYSKDIVYNNFPWPENVSEVQKAELERLAQEVLNARKMYPEATLADLYDPLTMPPELMKAHKALDKAVDRLYCKEAFADDLERVEYLFERYAALLKA